MGNDRSFSRSNFPSPFPSKPPPPSSPPLSSPTHPFSSHDKGRPLSLPLLTPFSPVKYNSLPLFLQRLSWRHPPDRRLAYLSSLAETDKVLWHRQRESLALRAMPGGLVAHTLDEQRDINDARSIFGDAAEIKTDPEMVQLAKQLIDRQTAAYDPSDLEDRYETRLRMMIDAKLKGEGIDVSEPAEPDRTNVVDLMVALKKSLAQEAAPKEAAQSSASAKPKRAAAAQAAKPGRKRA